MSPPLRILQVEDNPTDAELVIRHLRRGAFTYTVHRVETEDAFLAALDTPIDIVLSDYQLPLFSGLRALELLRASPHAATPFILISGTIGEDQAVESMRLGASDYLLKDRLARLPQAITHALADTRLRRERAEALQALRTSEELFRQMAENIDEVFWMTDPESRRILYISPAYEKIWGRSPDSLRHSPQDWLQTIHPDDRPRITDAKRLHQTHGTYNETYRILRPDGSIRWIRDKAYPIKDNHGTPIRIVGVAEDITAHHQLEEQLRQTQKLESLGTLAGGIAHDFNNILGAISGFNELIRMGSADPELRENTDAIAKAVRRAADLVKQILAFSRSQEQQRIPLNPKPVINEAWKLLRASVPRTIELDMHWADDTPSILADPTQIHQVVMNLVTNAWHAIGEVPGRITLSACKRRIKPSDTTPHCDLPSGTYAQLSISDDGCGMPPAILSRIFDPFFTTKPVGQGTGLGLAVVHGIVTSCDGGIIVESHPSHGTTFHLLFPALDSATTSPLPVEAPMPRGAGQEILLVDDESAFIFMAQKALARLGYTVCGHTSAPEALDHFRQDPARFALLIADHTMPRMTGLEFSRHCLALRPELPVILLTGYTLNLTPEQIQKLGVNELLTKPISLSTLAVTVQKLLSAATTQAHA